MRKAMKIIVVADTHKDFKIYNEIVEKNPADYYIHLGDGVNEFADVAKLHPDKAFVFVKGECDFCTASSKQLLKFFRMNIVTHPAAVDCQPKVCNKRGQLFNALCIRCLV